MLKPFALFCLLCFANTSNGQSLQIAANAFNCLPQTIFKTDSLGNYKEKLPFPLTFTFKGDSIIVGNSLNLQKEFMSFKIEKKDFCEWNKDYTVGRESYHLLMTYEQYIKHPKLNIIYKPNGKKYIELLYENSEERIFTIIQ